MLARLTWLYKLQKSSTYAVIAFRLDNIVIRKLVTDRSIMITCGANIVVALKNRQKSKPISP